MGSNVKEDTMSADDKGENDLARELDAILDSYHNALTAEQAGPNEEEQRAFLERFERIKTEVIKPVMSQVGKYLETRGHSFNIQDEAGPYADNPSIRMEIYPQSTSDRPIQDHEFPMITFIAEPDLQTVGVEVRDGMPGRPGLTRGHIASVDSITSDYVRNQLVAVLKINFVERAQTSKRPAGKE